MGVSIGDDDEDANLGDDVGDVDDGEGGDGDDLDEQNGDAEEDVTDSNGAVDEPVAPASQPVAAVQVSVPSALDNMRLISQNSVMCSAGSTPRPPLNYGLSWRAMQVLMHCQRKLLALCCA